MKQSHNRATAFLWILCLLTGSILHASENWTGYEDGHLHHNASTFEINPTRLKLLWQRIFDDPVSLPGGIGSGVTHGSRNLVCVNGRLAILQTSDRGLPREFMKGAFAKGCLSLLDASSGNLIQCIRVTLRDGNRHNWWYPTGLLVDAADTLGGMHVLHWDKATGILFIRSGGDGCFATAYKPLANLESYKAGTLQEGVPAFAGLGTRGDPLKISNTEPLPFGEEFWQRIVTLRSVTP